MLLPFHAECRPQWNLKLGSPRDEQAQLTSVYDHWASWAPGSSAYSRLHAIYVPSVHSVELVCEPASEVFPWIAFRIERVGCGFPVRLRE